MIQGFTLIGTSKILTILSIFLVSYFKIDIRLKITTNDKSCQTDIHYVEEILKSIEKKIDTPVSSEDEYSHVEKPLKLKKTSYFSWN